MKFILLILLGALSTISVAAPVIARPIVSGSGSHSSEYFYPEEYVALSPDGSTARIVPVIEAKRICLSSGKQFDPVTYECAVETKYCKDRQTIECGAKLK